MVDASYYNTLPQNPCNLRGQNPGFNVLTSSYPRYWKQIGNSYLFRFPTPPGEPSNAEAVQLGKARHQGQINVLFLDSHAKAVNYEKLIADTPTAAYINSMWDPFKGGCQ
jgi:prepilin-type processing-associated H-X9-DG protein